MKIRMFLAQLVGWLAIVIAVIALPASVSGIGLAIMFLALWVSGVATFLGAAWCAPVVVLLSLLEVFPWFDHFHGEYEQGQIGTAYLVEKFLLCYAFPLFAIVWANRRRLIRGLHKDQ
jgi:hypothetical protein